MLELAYYRYLTYRYLVSFFKYCMRHALIECEIFNMKSID